MAFIDAAFKAPTPLDRLCIRHDRAGVLLHWVWVYAN